MTDTTQATNSKDWPEDLAHENGNYNCTCVHCGERFQGHKRRHTCRECAINMKDTTQTTDTIKPKDGVEQATLKEIEAIAECVKIINQFCPEQRLSILTYLWSKYT